MSQMIDFTLPSSAPGRMLHAFRCVPEGEVRAIVQKPLKISVAAI